MIKKRDVLLIGSLLFAACIGIFIAHITRRYGDTVVVYVDNKEYACLPLDEEAELIINGADYGSNKLIVKDGEAFISNADCPDKICVKTGAISQENETIVCLPGKIVVIIKRDG